MSKSNYRPLQSLTAKRIDALTDSLLFAFNPHGIIIFITIDPQEGEICRIFDSLATWGTGWIAFMLLAVSASTLAAAN